MIIGGRLEGGEICFDSIELDNRTTFEYAYVQYGDVAYFIAQGGVESITVVDSSNSGNILRGYLYLGITGAMIANQMKDNLIEITWTNGEKSLAKVSKEKFEKIMKCSYKTCNQIVTARKNREEKREKEKREREAYLNSPEGKKEERKEFLLVIFLFLGMLMFAFVCLLITYITSGRL